MNTNEETALVVQLFSAIKDGRDPVKVTQIIKYYSIITIFTHTYLCYQHF